MIIIGVDNTLDMGKDTIDYINAISKTHNIKIHHIASHKSIIYKNNKILSIKNYVDYLDKEEDVDLLVIEFKKESIENDLYRNINFDIIVLFDHFLVQKPLVNHKTYFEQKILKYFKCKYYLIPDTYSVKSESCISYGWNSDSDISLSSAQKDPEGNIQIQCCVQTCIPTQKGTLITPIEFPVYGKTQYTEGLLAGAAIFILGGFDADTFVLENNIYNMV